MPNINGIKKTITNAVNAGSKKTGKYFLIDFSIKPLS